MSGPRVLTGLVSAPRVWIAGYNVMDIHNGGDRAKRTEGLKVIATTEY
jgi:hypothetical protein